LPSARRTSFSFPILYWSNTLRVLWPVTFIATVGSTPARVRFRDVVRRKSWKIYMEPFSLLVGQLAYEGAQSSRTVLSGAVRPSFDRQARQPLCYRK